MAIKINSPMALFAVSIGTGPIYTPANANNDIEVTGTVTDDPGPCRRVWAKVLHGDWTSPASLATVPHPFASPVGGGFVVGIINAGNFRFTLADGNPVPGARGNGQQDTLLVWAAYDDNATIETAHQLCRVGSLSGSGATGSAGSLPVMGAGGSMQQRPAPKHYKIPVDFAFPGVTHPSGDLPPVNGGSEILLAFDEMGSSAYELIWRGVNLPVNGAWWQLSITADGAEVHAGMTPRQSQWTWKNTSEWQYLGRNALENAKSNLTLPDIHVEPA